MKNILQSLILVAMFAGIVSCKQNTPNPPYTYQTDPQYTWGYIQYFADYYSNYGIEQNVLTLNLFSDNLGIDTIENTLVGTGQYLILEDVFIDVEEVFLPEGVYSAVDTITEIQPFTFLKGKELKEKSSADGISSGAYIYYIETDASKNTIKYIDSGTFTVSYNPQNKTYTILCDFKTNDKKELKGKFTGELPHYNESVKVKAGVKRNKMFKIKL